MAQILRVHKWQKCCEILMFIRSYGTQRSRLNYYEILRVSPNSTQKEIKQAFFKLSKEMHPDVTGKGSHSDFVKINEAYSVLSKENTRRMYDMSLHSNNVYGNGNYSQYYNQQPMGYEVYRDGKPYTGFASGYEKGNHTKILIALCFGLIFSGALIQYMRWKFYATIHQRTVERTAKFEEELEKLRQKRKNMKEYDYPGRDAELMKRYYPNLNDKE